MDKKLNELTKVHIKINKMKDNILKFNAEYFSPKL